MSGMLVSIFFSALYSLDWSSPEGEYLFTMSSLAFFIKLTSWSALIFLIVSLVASYPLKFYSVTINNGVLSGRNYWYRKESFPITSVQRIRHSRDRDFRGYLIDAGDEGHIKISKNTHQFLELIDYIHKVSHVKVENYEESRT
jgi:hypothetical protein